MAILTDEFSSFEEFLEMRRKTKEILEYIDGIIYMSPSPNIKHQRISSFLHGELHNTLKGSKCEVFSAPTDILFDDANSDSKKIVVPDLFVTCSPNNFTENEYVGAPDFIIEILSPSNVSHDIITKLNLYMKNGVKEYWIVDPIENRILVYNKDENNEIQYDVLHSDEKLSSKVISAFKMNVADIFIR